MRRKIKLTAVSAGALLAVSVSLSNLSAGEGLLSCLCTGTNEFNNRLPQSHPVNRCANNQAIQSGVSWSSWLFGNGNSRQFHYLDLLELLSRYVEGSEDEHHRS